MKQISEERTIESNGTLASNAFAIKTSPQAFQLLSSGLYTNKIQAVLRELGCNAVDAHMAAGVPKTPIEVKLPNALDKQFYVKDFGTGLSHDQIMRLYTTYFDSTKQASNDFIGGFGVGSKSPFAYTDSFTVESRFNGTKRIYSAYVNEDGIPTISQLMEEASTEPNGLTIGFPVKPEVINTFAKEAALTYKWFETPPTIRGANLVIDNTEGLRLGKLWLRSDSNYGYNNNAAIRMGSVAYPVGTLFNNISLDDFDADSEEHSCLLAARSLLSRNSNWVVDLPIGSSLVAASREALQFDKKSVASLKNALIPVMQEAVLSIHNIVNAKVKNIRDYYSNVETFTQENNLGRNTLLFMLNKHNPNYHPDGIKLHNKDYPSLVFCKISTSSIEDFYYKVKQKKLTLGDDEVQRRIRRKITTSYNENGQSPDYSKIDDMLWPVRDTTLKVWPHDYTENTLADALDMTLASCNSSISSKIIIARQPGVSDIDFNKDLDKLTTYLNLKKEILIRPIKPPPKKLIKTEDIYGITIDQTRRAALLSKLSRQRMVTSEISSKIIDAEEYAYVVFDKKAFPNSNDDAVSKYETAHNKYAKLKDIKRHESIRSLIDAHIPKDGFIMIEKTDLPIFKQICPKSKPLENVMSSIQKDKTIFKALKDEVATLPHNASYNSNTHEYIVWYKKACDFCKTNGTSLENTLMHEIVNKWIKNKELSDSTSEVRSTSQRAAVIGTSLLNWPTIIFPDAIDVTNELNKLQEQYPILSSISSYNNNHEMITKYILDQDELRLYRTYATTQPSMSV